MFLIIGHPRSGSHFLTALIAVNFFNTNNYIQFYGGHADKFRDSFKNKKIIYSWRNFEETSQSIFKIRKRFGICTDNFTEFLNRPLKDLWSNNLEFEIKVDYITEQKIVNKVDALWKNTNKTLYDYWFDHINYWTKREDVLSIKYEDLMKSNETELKKVANFIGKEELVEIKRIDEKVGWIPLN
jgi:hypothetical protein